LSRGIGRPIFQVGVPLNVETHMTTSTDSPNVIVRPPLLYLGGVILLLALRWLWPAPILGDAAPGRWAGGVLAVAALGLGLWAVATMRAAGTNVDPGKASTAMVTAGPFGFTRNPIYVGLAVLFLGVTLIVDSWWGLAVLVPLLAVMHTGVIRREEAYLDRKFGDVYRRYKASVGRYVG